MGELGTRVGGRIRNLRRRAGITQAELAERLDVAGETVSRIERAATEPPLATIERIVSVLGTDLDEFLSGLTGPRAMGNSPLLADIHELLVDRDDKELRVALELLRIHLDAVDEARRR
jgi:transcriptional regulator with XRE-family HTH domain